MAEQQKPVYVSFWQSLRKQPQPNSNAMQPLLLKQAPQPSSLEEDE